MNLGNLIPSLADIMPAIVRLGRRKWLSVSDNDNQTTAVQLHWDAFDRKDPDDRRAMSYIEETRELCSRRGGCEALAFKWLECLGRLACDGVKLFRPTVEQCEAMEQVEVRLPVGDYRQPYPAMLIEFPEAYRQELSRRLGSPVPRFMCSRYHAEIRGLYIASQVVGGAEALGYAYWMAPHERNYDTIEQVLNTNYDKVPASSVCKYLARVVINLMLMLSHFGHREAPSNPSHLDKARRRLAKNRTQANEVEVSSHVYDVVPAQEIVVRMRDTPSGEASGTHESPAPHWRRGHWRRYPGYRDVVAAGGVPKMVFIRPVFVRAVAFTGDLGETSAAYKVRGV